MTERLLPKPFVFMRHAQTEANARNLICGRLDWPLNEQGCQQAQVANAVLAGQVWSHIAISPALRVCQTAELAVPGALLHIVPDLRERDWGDMEGQPLTEQPAYEATPPGGEPWTDFVQRVTAATNQILASHKRPLIIAHSGFWRVLNFQLNGSPYGPRLPNATPMQVTPGVTPGDEWAIEPL